MTLFHRFRRRPGPPVRDAGPPPSPNGASSFHFWWDVAEPLAWVAVDLEVSVPPGMDSLAFFALQASFWSADRREGGAHAGLQHHPDYPGGRAANWGGYDRDGSLLPGSDSELPSALDNPNTRDFHWETESRYRLTIGPRLVRPDQTAWPARIRDRDAEREIIIRELFCPGDRLRDPVVWAELFGDCDAPGATARWTRPRAAALDGRLLPVVGGRVSYQTYEAGGCSNTDVSVREGAVVQQSNCDRRTPHQAFLAWEDEDTAREDNGSGK